MGTLSDLVGKFKSTLNNAGLSVASGLGITKEGIQSANKYIQNNPTLNAAAQPGLSGLIATPKAIVTEIAPIVGERFREAQKTYEESGARNPIMDVISTVGSAPVLFGEGVSGVADESKNTLQKIKSGTDSAMAVAQTNPWTTAWNVAYEGLVPADIKKTVNDSITGLNQDAANFGIKQGLSKENAEALAGIAQNVVGVAASIFGIKAGNATGAALRKAALPTLGRKAATQAGNVSNVATNALIQASPQIIPVVYDYFKNNQNKPEAFTEASLVALGQQVATMIPLGGKNKYRPKGALSKISEENKAQTKMDIMPEQAPINPNPDFTPNEKTISDMYRTGKIPAVQLDSDPRLTPDQKAFTINDLQGTADITTGTNKNLFTKKQPEQAPINPNPYKLLSDLAKEQDNALITTKDTTLDTTEQITLGEEGAPEVPRENSAKVSQELTTIVPDIEMAGGNNSGDGTLYTASKQNVIDTPTIEMKVGGLEKLRGFINSNINFQGFLNNLAIKGKDGKAISADSYLDQARSVANNVARTITKPLEDMLLTITDNKRFFNKKVDLDAKDLIGTTTPEGILITPDNYKKVYDTYNNIKGQHTGQSHTILENDARINLQKKSFIYDLMKDDPKKLEKYFDPKELEVFKNTDILERETYAKYAKDLVDAGYLKDIEVANEYIRYVMGAENYKRAMKDLGIKDEGFIIQTSNGPRKFDTAEDVLKYYKYQGDLKKRGKPTEINVDEANLASVLKDKADKQFDIYRTHGAVNRIMSYGDSIGELYGNAFKSDLFNDIAKSTEPGVQAYIKNLLENHKNIIEEAYGIKEQPGIKEKLSRLGTIAAIAGNTKTLAQAIIGTPIKTFTTIVTNLNNPKSALAGLRGTILKSKEVKNTLQSEGFVTGYELMEGGGVLNNSVGFFSGTDVENMGKSVIALNGMHKTLKDNGYKPSTNAESIVAEWQKFKKEKPEAYLGAHERISKATKFVADVTDSARLQVGWGRKFLAPVKTYAVQQTKTMFDDAVDAVSGALLRKKGYEGITEGAARRTAARLLTYTLGIVGANLLTNDKDEELSDEKAKALNDEYGYSPLALGKGAFGMNTIVAIPVNMASDVTQAITDLLQTDKSGITGNKKVALQTALRGLNQNLGAMRSVENATRELTGKGFAEWIAGYDPNNLTESGISKGNEYSTDTAMKIFRAFGFGENAMEEKFARENLDEIIPKEWAQVKIAGMNIVPTDTVGALKMIPIAGSFVQPISDMVGHINSFENRIQGIDAMNTAEQIDGAKTLDQVISRIDLEKKDSDALKTKIQEHMNRYMNEHSDIKLAMGKDFLSLDNKGLGMDIDRLKTVDPVIYNDLVSLISHAQRSNNPSNAIKEWKGSTPQEQALIAQYNKTAPLTTSLSNEVGTRVEKTLGEINNLISYNEIGTPTLSPEGRIKFDTALGKIDKMAEFFVRMKDDMGMHEKGVALNSLAIGNHLKTIQALQLEGSLPMDYLDGFPFMRTLVKNGLQLRGEEITPTTQGTPTAQQTSVPQATTSSAKSGLSALASGVIGKKPEWENIKYKERKIEPLIKDTRPMTLSELLKGQSKKSPTKSGRQTKK